MPKHIKKLVESYIEKPNNLIVVVVSASEDVALSLGIREARKFDKEGMENELKIIEKYNCCVLLLAVKAGLIFFRESIIRSFIKN